MLNATPASARCVGTKAIPVATNAIKRTFFIIFTSRYSLLKN
jgi:hypothetical protein